MSGRGRLRGLAVPALLMAALAASSSCDRAPDAPRSAVVIVIDTCRFDEVGRLTDQGPVTPFLDGFAAGAARFSRATSPAPWTLPSFATLLTSTYPSVHGAGGHSPSPEFSRLRSAVPTGPQILSNAGFRTAAFVNCLFLDPTLGLDRGFEKYDFHAASALDVRRADATLAAALEWVAEHQGERFFLLVQLFDAHMDFDPPEPFRSRFLEGVPQPFEPPFSGAGQWRVPSVPDDVRDFARALYRGEIAAADSAIGDFVRGIGRLGITDDTVLVITADHGEEFWDHGFFEHGHSLHEELIHVPLLVRVPRQPVAREIGARVGLVDVMPTLFDLLDLPGSESFQGRSLVPWLLGDPDAAGSPAFSEAVLYGPEWKAVTTGRYKYLVDEQGRARLYDLQEDPTERSSVVAENPDVAARLGEQLAAWHRANRERSGGRERGEVLVDMSEMERLRSLGYVD